MKRPKQWPFRQHDPRWKSNVMWDRKTVIEIARKYNGLTKNEANCLLYEFITGNTIGNEGCLITCLSMILQMLYRDENDWTPAKLNYLAQEYLYYSTSGLSMATLYADIVGEASNGHVQLFLKEEYHSGTPGFPKVYCSNCIPLQAYLSLSQTEKTQFALMIKTGTYDDTFASHFLLVDPDQIDSNNIDISVLDPYQPINSRKTTWLLSDSSKLFTKDPAIRSEWNYQNIELLQIAGIWVFCRWNPSSQKMLGEPFIAALSKTLS